MLGCRPSLRKLPNNVRNADLGLNSPIYRIIVSIEVYGFQHCGYWLVKVALVLWIIETAIAVVLSIYLPLVHFLDHPHGHKEMPPSFMLMPTVIIYTATVAYGIIGQVPV